MNFPEWLSVFGDQSFRGQCPQEHVELVTFFNVLKKYQPEIARIALHPRNEGKRTYGQARMQKSEGLCSGAADIIIPARVPFVCELKRADHTKSKWEEGQPEFLEAAYKEGAFVCVGLGYVGAIDAFNKWLTIK